MDIPTYTYDDWRAFGVETDVVNKIALNFYRASVSSCELKKIRSEQSRLFDKHRVEYFNFLKRDFSNKLGFKAENKEDTLKHLIELVYSILNDSSCLPVIKYPDGRLQSFIDVNTIEQIYKKYYIMCSGDPRDFVKPPIDGVIENNIYIYTYALVDLLDWLRGIYSANNKGNS